MAPPTAAPLGRPRSPSLLLLPIPATTTLLLLLLLATPDTALAQVTTATGGGGGDDNNNNNDKAGGGELSSPPAPANQTAAPGGFGRGTKRVDAPPPAPPETGLSTPASGGEGDDEDLPPTGGTRCRGYYDVMGQWDPPFNCNAGVFLYCCGTCFYRFCCQFRQQRLDQNICSNYDTPIWANTGKPVAAVTEGQGNQDRDRTHLVVYIICGVVAIMVLVGIFTKLALEKSRGAAAAAAAAMAAAGGGGVGGMGNHAHHDLSNTRTLTELLKQPGGEGLSSGSGVGGSPSGRRANGVSSKMLRSRSEQYHLNNSAYGPFGPALPHPHSNHSLVGLNKYASLKAVAGTASRSYYKSYPLMDFAQYQAAAGPGAAANALPPPPPPHLHHKEKSYLHPAPPGHHDPRGPLSISIPPGHLVEHAHLPPKTSSHPASVASSAFKTWEPRSRQVQRQASAPGHAHASSSSSSAAAAAHPSARRHAYSARRQQSIENLPDLFSQPYAGAGPGAGPGAGLGGYGDGQQQQQQQQQQQGYQQMSMSQQQHPYYHHLHHHARQKSFSTHSKTEVTV